MDGVRCGVELGCIEGVGVFDLVLEPVDDAVLLEVIVLLEVLVFVAVHVPLLLRVAVFV